MLLGTLSDSTRNGSDTAPCDGKILPPLGTNQIAGFVEQRPLKHREKK